MYTKEVMFMDVDGLRLNEAQEHQIHADVHRSDSRAATLAENSKEKAIFRSPV